MPAIFREFPRVKRRLWGGELWEDGYFARTVGDKVTAEIIRTYINTIALRKLGTRNCPCLNRFCPSVPRRLRRGSFTLRRIIALGFSWAPLASV